MEITAVTNQVRISPRKVRLIADSIRDLSLDQAIATLQVLEKRGAKVIEKTIMSAIANATNNASIEKERLVLSAIEVMEGPALKRYHASTRGRIHPYKRRSSNIRIVLKEKGDVKIKS